MAPRPLVSLNSRLVACSARIVVHTHTHTHTHTLTHKPSTVTLAAHARRGLITKCREANITEELSKPDGTLRVIIGTIAFGMGIHLDSPGLP